MRIKSLLTLISLISPIKCEMEPFVVGGKRAKIKDFPHSGFLKVRCKEISSGEISPWVCGSSILNTKIVLTAAHCLWGCATNSNITITVGHSHNHRGKSHTGHSFVVHGGYVDTEFYYDIALARINAEFVFGPTIKRVALLKKPPYFEKAQVAGWGLTDEIMEISSNILYYINQTVWKKEDCEDVIGAIPKGTICASSKRIDSYVAM
ncbi:chymotrypsin-like [Trichoplusia ni]|uniref:Chymotrypsin-like n=1 Tax=Trichoplusia ni TaxID=7111 RepID=A0A7E5VEK5_TRINI|nr:chymotrypsin-like [Trichoplusia ni]